LDTIQGRLNELGRDANGFQLCIYYAGMDPHEGCAFGGLPGIDDRMLRQRDKLIFDWLVKQNIPCAFSLGGGYIGPGLDRDGLVSLHRGTVELAVETFFE
jgi:acetoin utilization deacetylase AcuC-like enzyme